MQETDMFAELRTERLTLRDLEVSDAERIFQYRTNPEVCRFQSWGTQSVEENRNCIRKLSAAKVDVPGPWYQLGITLLSTNELIGDTGFRMPEAEPRQAEIGITLAPEYQGHGYATETVRGLLDFLLIKRAKHRVFASVDPANVRSARLMERVGMRREGCFVKSRWFRGEWVDDVIFAMLASEWKSGRGGGSERE
jgi:RimJ/RimL family protein N-acetyltransferase